MSYQCRLDKDSEYTFNQTYSPVNGYRGTDILEPCYPVHGAGPKYTGLANWESLSDTRLMGILGNGIPLV